MTAPPSPEYIPAKHQGGRQDVIKRIVIHGTVSRTYCGGAKAIARYFQNPTYVSSAHYVVDPCEEYQCVYDHTIAWHDGTNTNSIGVEMCDPVEGSITRWDGGPHQKMLIRTANLVRQLCLAYDIPMRHLTPAQIRAGEKGICGHVDMRDAFPGSTSHWDPGAFPWARFLSLVREEDDDMPLSKEDVARIARATATELVNRDAVPTPYGNKDNPRYKVKYAMAGAWDHAYRAQKAAEQSVRQLATLAGRIAALEEAHRQEAAGESVDYDRVTAAAEAGARAAIESSVLDVDITVNDKTGEQA